MEKKTMYNRKFISTLLFLFGISIAQAQELTPEKMEEMMALAQPGPEHQMLEKMVGNWEQTVKFWMKSGAEPSEMKGKSVNKMILGGRFLQSDVTGGEGEMAMEGLNLMGYDRRHKKFTTVGFDTWGTYYVTAAGPYNKETKSIVMYGEDEEPTAGITQKYDIIVRFVDDDTYINEIVFKDARTPDQKEFKMVEVTNKRVK
jgi:hypothetical protein